MPIIIVDISRGPIEKATASRVVADQHTRGTDHAPLTTENFECRPPPPLENRCNISDAETANSIYEAGLKMQSAH